MSKTLVIGTIVVVVGLFALGGFLLWQQAGLGPSSPTPPPPSPSLQETSESGAPRDQAELDFAGWQTYRNDEFGFEVKYPENWEIREFESKIDIGIFRLPEYYAISFSRFENSEKLLSAQYAEKHFEKLKNTLPDYEVTSLGTEEIYVGGYLGSKVRGLHVGVQGEPTIDLIFISLSNQNSIYQIQFPTDSPQPGERIIDPEENYEIATQILATFRFVE